MIYDVEFRNVSKHFGDFIAIDSIDLQVRKGEFLTLLGPSGCGKSTSLRMIAGFIHPTEGEVLIAGEVMGRRPPYRRESSMVFQDYALFPHMSVFENIGFGLKERGESKQIIEEKVGRILEGVGLTAFVDRRPGQLSGGQQQRVALARSLVLEPTVLLLDEPLGALDLKMRHHMQVELKDLQHRVGITFIYVTHDQEEALVMSDRIAVMNNGRIEQIGPSYELYENPRTLFVADFIGETNLMTGTVDAVDGEDGSVAVDGLTVVGRRSDEVGVGDRVHVSIRPEKIRSGDQSTGCETVTDGEIVNVVYKGSIIRYELMLRNGTRLIYDEHTKYHPEHFAVGDTLKIGWSARDAVIIKHT
ncbi:MAG: ABC transporter ATP-binding protein [Proteobacteria bacterium]|nr:ABC transporter ATP-binding protein [Pseudomonadota bacterium]